MGHFGIRCRAMLGFNTFSLWCSNMGGQGGQKSSIFYIFQHSHVVSLTLYSLAQRHYASVRVTTFTSLRNPRLFLYNSDQPCSFCSHLNCLVSATIVCVFSHSTPADPVNPYEVQSLSDSKLPPRIQVAQTTQVMCYPDNV